LPPEAILSAWISAQQPIPCYRLRATAPSTSGKPKIVVHGAAMTAVDACETSRAEAWKINVGATALLAGLCAASHARLVYVSTDYVFDGRLGGYRESDGLSPLGVYAQTKAAGELAARTICENTVVTRTSVPFGPYAHVKKDFVRWLREELQANKRVSIVRDQVSNPTYAPDLARMIVRLAISEFKGIVHTAGATSLSRLDFAQRIAREFKLDESLIDAIDTSNLKQAAPRPLNAGMSVQLAFELGLEPLAVEQALHHLRARLEL
jgi:dTDP-4-dehydrorhamnose reductase